MEKSPHITNIYSRQLGPSWSISLFFSKKIILLMFLQQYSVERNLAIFNFTLTLTLPNWRIWWAPNNASRWQMEFNSAFEGLFWSSLRIENIIWNARRCFFL